MGAWADGDDGVLRLPSGRLIRGRGVGRPMPAGQLPEFSVFVLGTPPAPVDWPSRWVRWPDFRLPADPAEAGDALYDAWRRAAHERVEVACHGGQGRTGTALACIAVLDGVPSGEAVDYVRTHYLPGAVETRRQRRFVVRFGAQRDR